MAPRFDKTLPPAVYDVIRDHPLPVWLGRGDGKNLAVSRVYEAGLGRAMEGEGWVVAADSDYSQSYTEFRTRRKFDEVWEHPLAWTRPDTGEEEHHLSRARWVNLEGKWWIIGEIHLNRRPIPCEIVEPRLSWWVLLVQQVAIFCVGLVCGLLLARWTP